VVFVTGNIHKFHEAIHVFSKYNLSTAFIRIKKPEIQDDDIENIATTSAIEVSKKCNLPIIIEDSGLFIRAVNGFPGPYSSYVYRKLGTKGILKLLHDEENRDAYFQSVVTFSDPTTSIVNCFHGKVEGIITHEERGQLGFGFDPVFKPSPHPDKTFGEMNINEKTKHSHRSKALRKFALWYVTNFPQEKTRSATRT
jgi:XTP/dITP diphosphohydrolase